MLTGRYIDKVLFGSNSQLEVHFSKSNLIGYDKQVNPLWSRKQES